MAHGLNCVYDICAVSGYEAWHYYISRGETKESRPRATQSINEIFRVGANKSLSESLLDQLPFWTLSNRKKSILAGRPFYDEPDNGPPFMWAWVYNDTSAGQLVANPRTRGCRRWAFPFWDLSRLTKAELICDPAIPINIMTQSPEYELEEYNTEERLESLRLTQNARCLIWESGGTGWYDVNDLTKIKWSRDKPDWLY